MLLPALTMLITFETDEEMDKMLKSKMRFQLQLWMSVTRMTPPRKDASNTDIKWQFLSRTVKETQQTNIQCLNQESLLKFHSTWSQRRWSFFPETKLASGSLQITHQMKDWDWHQILLIHFCHHQWRKDIKLSQEDKLSQDCLAMIWRSLIPLNAKTSWHIVQVLMIRLHWLFRELVMFIIWIKSAKTSSVQTLTGPTCKTWSLTMYRSSMRSSKLMMDQEIPRNSKSHQWLWRINLATWLKWLKNLTFPTLLDGDLLPRNNNVSLVIT